ncbi:PDZ and LIM domain protein 2 [Copidosoma floridanum]|uniref:PDZ and LIM domain protein 2 n=1 Tax=Copidosoma floridanum TaxID=29053 RepID=UPI000C6FB20D|nr:PDZ and LIM domain protein 2 [Copidosoma floridanum]
MTNKRHSLIVKLRRPCRAVPWGISIAGGADLGTPLVVTRSENEDLHKGDVIKKIDEYDVRDLRHVDAQTLLQNSESVVLAVERSDLPYNIISKSNNSNADNDRTFGSEYHHHHHHHQHHRSDNTSSASVVKTSVITCNGSANNDIGAAASVDHVITLKSIRSTKFVNEPMQTPITAPKDAPIVKNRHNDGDTGPVGRQFRQIFKLLCARLSEQLILQLL